MKRLCSPSRISRVLTAAVFWLLAGLPAAASEVPKLEKGNEGWIGVVIAIVLVVAVGVASFINPKRSHQD
jgi:hypothetical protein